jgi:Methyltransferase domain
MHFDEYWIGPQQIAFTAILAASTHALPGEAVEIGAWQGLSTIALANAVIPSTLHVVDHWLGDEPEAVADGTGIKPELVERDNYGIFLANMKEGTSGNFKVWKMGWREWAAQWDEPIRFLHLDATHTEKEVTDTLNALLPHAVPGTVFAGDDYNWPGVGAAVRKRFGVDEIRTYGDKLWWVTLDKALLVTVLA